MNITPITPWFTNVRGSRNARRIPPTIVTICTPSCNKKVNVEIDRAIANWKAAQLSPERLQQKARSTNRRIWQNPLGLSFLSRSLFAACMYYNSKCLLPMKMNNNTVQLPKISIKELEERVKSNYSRSPLFPSFHPNNLPSNDLKIISPFYHRLLHDSKCECQYHKLKKASQEIIRRIKSKENDSRSRFKHLTHYHVSNQSDSTLREMVGKHKRKTYNKYLEPLGNTTEEQSKEKSVLQQQRKEQEKNGIQFSSVVSGGDVIHRMAKMVEIRKVNWSESSRVDAINKDYISLINQRFKNNQYKSDYLKNIFRFIRMKAKEDRHYIKQSRAYLQNSLNILLNHYQIGRLLKYNQLDQSQLSKIAYTMNCKQQISKKALVDLKKVVDQMERHLQNLKQKVSMEAQNPDSIFVDQVVKTEMTSNSNENSEGTRFLTVSSSNQLLQDRSTTKLQKINDNDFSTSKDKFINLRKSKKGINYCSISLLKNTDSATSNSENKLRISGRHSQIYQNSNSNLRSQRSTILGIVDQQESEHYKAKNKKSKIVKVRRVKASPKPTILQYDQKYATIKYENYCTKDTFIKLISQIQRLDRNDSERAQIAYRMLVIQKFIDNEQKLAEMFEAFAPLISQSCKEQLLKQIVVIKDQRLIEKLARQLDDMLTSIKRTDPRMLDTEELFPYKEDPILQKPPPQRIIHYKGNQGNRCSVGKQIILYQAQQRVERHRRRQISDKQELQQAQLDEIKVQSLQPNLTQSIYHNQGLKKQPICKNKIDDYTSNKQKKILQYMHKNHSNTFNYLSNQITSLCKTLIESDTNA